jgi:hypothetical protein
MPNFIQRKWKDITLLLISIVITFGAIEISLRLIYPDELLLHYQGIRSREYHHSLPPNVKMFQGRFDGKTAVVTTNEDGLRTKYSRREFLSHKNRIIILGDSFTFGWRLRQEAAFPEVAETLLRERMPSADVAILNAGIISYSPLLENQLFNGALKEYKPTFVVLTLDATDIGDDFQYASEATRDGERIFFNLDNTVTSVRYYGALGELTRHFLKRVFNYNTDEYDYTRFHIAIAGTVERNRFFIFRYPLDSTRTYFANTLKNIASVASAAQKCGAGFVLFVTPRFQHWNMKECPRNWEKNYYALPEPYQAEYIRFFEEEKQHATFSIVNLLPAFQATKEFPLVFEDDPHWNERGNAFVANLVVTYLMEHDAIR